MSTKNLIRRAVFFLVSLSPLFASQSVVWTGSMAGRGVLPTSGLGNWWGALTNLDLEMNVTGLVVPATTQGLFELDSHPLVTVQSTGNINTTGFNNESLNIALNGCTNFRLRWQRNTSTMMYTSELWCESTGVYTMVSIPITGPTTVNFAGYHFSIGSFYEPTNPTVNFGAIRILNANVPTGGAPPPRLLPGSLGVSRRGQPLRLGPPGALADFEFAGNLTDSSAAGLTFALSSGSASYITTPVTNPAVSQNINTLLVGSTTSGAVITGINAFANHDNATLTYVWSQTAGTPGTFSSSSVLSPTYTPAAFGQSTLQLIVTDADSNATTIGPLYFGGVVLLPGTNNVDIATEAGGGITGAQIKQLLGGSMMHGTFPWSWFDDRFVTAANQQIINTPTFFSAYWLTADPNGTISCTGGGVSPTCTGSGTRFQTDFCNGGTSPANPGSTGIVIAYPSSAAISGTGYAHYGVTGCPSQTSITLQQAWIHTVSNLTGASYNADPTGANWGNWAYSPIPANYYDNVLAYFREWYRTGLTVYKTAAETLASRWFSGPVWDSGMSFNTNVVGGAFIVGSPGRGISPAGIVLWGLESGANIWPGIRYLWSYEGAGISFTIATGQLGDIRDAAYVANIEGLCVSYDPSPPSHCATDITTATDTMWGPIGITSGTPLETTGVLQSPAVDNAFTATEINSANYGDGTHWSTNCPGVACHVSLVNGSAVATIMGSTWNCDPNSGTFFSPEFPNPNLHQFLWFYNDPTQPTVPGNSNGGDANHAATGDDRAYTIASCDSPTQVHLSAPYAGTTGNHGLQVSIYAGFGIQGFMAGIASGLFGDWNYNAFVKLGQTQEAINAKRIATDMMAFLQNYGMDTNFELYFGRTFLNCEGFVNTNAAPVGWTPNNDPGCAGALATNVEIMHGCVVAYQLNPSSALRTFCDNTMTAMFCKTGYTCAGYSQINGTYATQLDDWPIGYDITQGANGLSSAVTNKWFGYFFGISSADAWAVARQGGPAAMGSSVGGPGAVASGQVAH